MSQRLLSIAQLAERWGWRENRLYRLVRAQEIPFLRIGGRICFRESAIDAWLDAREQRPVDVASATPVRRTHAEECERLGLPVDHRYAS